MPDEEKQDEVNDDYWLCPLEAIETIGTALYNIGESSLTEAEKTKINSDLTAVLFQATQLAKKIITDQRKQMK